MTSRNQEPGTRNQVTGADAEARGFRGLLAWQKADKLAVAVYRTLNALPRDHRWLAVQAMRAAISVPANIAEGYGRGSLGDYVRFLDIARGSLAEVEYYLQFLEREALIPASEAGRLQQLRHETGKLLHGLWKSLKQKARDGGWDRTGLVREEQAPYVTDIAPLEEDDAYS